MKNRSIYAKVLKDIENNPYEEMKQMDSKKMTCLKTIIPAKEEQSPIEPSPRQVSAKHSLDDLEEAAYAMASIRRTEIEKERREKNRIAAKKSREKKIHYIEEMEKRLYFENKRNQKMHQDITALYVLLESILYETESLLDKKHLEITEIANIFIVNEKYINFPVQHREIIDHLRYLLFTNRKTEI